MKSASTQNKSTPTQASKPFFNKGDEGSFFASRKETERPFFQPFAIQRDLAVGQPDDPYEQEADKIGRQVMNNFDRATGVQRKLSAVGLQTSLLQLMPVGPEVSRRVQPRQQLAQAKCPECEQQEKLAQPKALGIQFAGDGAMVSPGIESRIKSHNGGGRPMDTVTRSAMEASFGADFSNVKVHTGSSAVQMSQELNAHAFTVGSNIFFNKDRYQPHTREGAGLLAHELTHTVQQGAAVQNKGISRNPLSAVLSKHEVAHLSSIGGNGLNRKEIAQLKEKWPEDETVQQGLLQTKRVNEVKKKDSGLSLRMCKGGAKNKKAKLKSGPTYTPNGTLKATLGSDGRKYSPEFTRSAEFEHDPSQGIYASCGIIKQSIKWSSDADRPNHPGWTPASNYDANKWYEDRNASGLRASPRSGPTSFCASGATNGIYKDTDGNRDCANGPIFEGHDRPMDGSGAKTGTWDFKLEAIDICNDDKVLGTDTLTVDW